MKTLNPRFLFAACALLAFGGAALQQSGQTLQPVAKLTRPLESAAQSVSEGAQQAANFGSFLPGSFK